VSNLVIVAIPASGDDVWQVSSERKPHMTICFLGDAETNPNVPKISSYVKEQADRLAPFNLRVDHRGTLGVDEADVLFFADDIPWQVIDFRESLLADMNIRSAYNSVPQHTKWNAHLTLGYPETPAKPDNWDPMGTQYVQFDKIGVWFSDFGGIEIPLVDKSPQVSTIQPDVAWSEAVENVLAHHGVKGQKWGVRKSEPSKTVTITTKGKNKTKATGGEGLPIHKDAVAKVTVAQTKKKSGVNALSDEDLRKYANRLQLEQQVKRLEFDSASPSKKFIKKLLGQQGGQAANQVASQATNKAVKKALAKTALAAA
jgi:2'-5' RNA ligase